MISPLDTHKRLGNVWARPRPYGAGGFLVKHSTMPSSIIVSQGQFDDREWVHASIAHRDRMPNYDELVMLHKAVFGPTGWSYQCFVPGLAHVNIHAHALHLWGLADGTPALPNFGMHGSI